MNLIYLAKPTYGGWVSFTAHLACLQEAPLFKVAKKTETSGGKPRVRPFGYGINYRNVSLKDWIQLVEDSKQPYLITAVDKNYHAILPEMPPNGYLVIHDPTEIKAGRGAILPHLSKFKIITIRESVASHLTEQGIPNQFLPHPYVSMSISSSTQQLTKKEGAVSISRIDYDKHTEIILRANQILLKPVQIYGAKNDRYVYHHLKTLDPMRELMPGSNYRGKFPKEVESVRKILQAAKFVVDLSRIRDDGGGSQYTFLEAIDFGCILILHRDWVKHPQSKFKAGVNCLAVEDDVELSELLNSGASQYNLEEILENSRDLLPVHLEAGGWDLTKSTQAS